MRILIVHNSYREPGGEDVAFETECEVLERYGHQVFRHHVSNCRLGPLGALGLTVGASWNAFVYRRLRREIRRLRPDVLHLHNTFPRISPAAGYAGRAEGVPTVQTLHNYRLLCANGCLHREGAVCRDCLGRRVPLPAVRHACYRGSRAASAAVALMQATHNLARTWGRTVDVFIALSEFARAEFVASGLIPPDRIVVKPNSIAGDPGMGKGGGGYALFVGRLSPEKGLDVLVKAWHKVGSRLPLKIVGKGPMEEELARRTARMPGVSLVGWVEHEKTVALMKAAEMLLVPSLWFEGSPMVVAEALAVGLPIVASDLGTLTELVDEGRTGLLVPASESDALARAVLELWARTDLLAAMRHAARSEYEERFSPDANYRSLKDAYRRAGAAAAGC